VDLGSDEALVFVEGGDFPSGFLDEVDHGWLQADFLFEETAWGLIFTANFEHCL
jgi:hypothetical protein